MQTQLHNSNRFYSEPPHLNELLCSLSSQAIFCSFSPRLGKITGWTDVDWLGKPLQSFIHPYDLATIKDCFDDILGGRTIKFQNIRFLMRDGSHVSWTLSFVPQNEGGGVTEVLVLGHLTDPKLRLPEEWLSPPLNPLRLFKENDRGPASTIVEYAGLAKLLEGMLGNAPIGFSLLDDNLLFICVNQTFSEMTGFSPAQHLGQPLSSLLPGVAALLEPVMQNVLATGVSVLEFEVEIPQQSCGVENARYSQISFYPIPDLHGGICGVATIAIDVTDRKRSEAKLKLASDELLRSNLALEEFSYIASHDLREPLRTVASFVQLLRDRYQGKFDEEADEYIAFAIDGAKRMQRLIEKILEYSRAGKIERELTKVNCTSIVQAVIDNLKVSIEEAGAKVTYESLPTVRGDEILITQTFQNLVANAVKFRGAVPPTIRISAKRELNTWVFSVADNGIGISPDHFDNVFVPFRKLHGQSEYAGSGLGLAICQKNIERLGGRIWVTSEVGKGSVFSFTIPWLGTGGYFGNESSH